MNAGAGCECLYWSAYGMAYGNANAKGVPYDAHNRSVRAYVPTGASEYHSSTAREGMHWRVDFHEYEEDCLDKGALLQALSEFAC